MLSRRQIVGSLSIGVVAVICKKEGRGGNWEGEWGGIGGRSEWERGGRGLYAYRRKKISSKTKREKVGIIIVCFPKNIDEKRNKKINK